MIVRFSQLGILIGLMGIILTLMGLFPGLSGIRPTPGIGVVQIFVMLVGYALLIIGALVYVKYTFYPDTRSNLVQQIGTRLAMTGLVLAAMAALADVLGFGSHSNPEDRSLYLGWLQALSIVASFVVSAIGVLIYAATGSSDPDD